MIFRILLTSIFAFNNICIFIYMFIVIYDMGIDVFVRLLAYHQSYPILYYTILYYIIYI